MFALGWIGDFVLTLSVIRRLIQEFGTEECVLVVSGPVVSLATREFPGVRCLTLPPDAASLVRDILPVWWRERGKFARDHFDHLVCLSHQRSLYYEVALSWIDAKHDVRLLPATYPTFADDDWCTELLAHHRVVESALGRTIRREDILPSFTSVPTGDDGRLLVYPLSRDLTRSMIPSPLIETLVQWRQHSAAPVVFAGSPADASMLGHYATAARAAGLSRVSVETPDGLDALLGQIAGAGALFCGDSAPAHIAAALDKHSTAMTSEAFYGYCQPWSRSERQKVFRLGTRPDLVAASLPGL